MPALGHIVDVLLNHLLWTSLQAAVLVGIVALIVRLLPRLPATARCALWWMVGLQVVIGLGWQAPVRLPWLSPPAHVFTLYTQSQPNTLQPALVIAPAAVQSDVVLRPDRLLNWRDALAAFWLLVVLAQLFVTIRNCRRMRGWLRDAGMPDWFLQRQCEDLSRHMGLRRCPRLRVSSSIASPLVTGFVRPAILWPADVALTPEETALALAHELAHVQRGDLWLGCIPAIAQRVLFFHPLVRWATREYAAHREATCDACAVQIHGIDPQRYGRLLLRLGVADLGTATLAGASSTFRGLQRRLLMLQTAGARVPHLVGWLMVALIALVGLVPYRLVAASQPALVHVEAGTSQTDTTATTPVACVPSVGADDIRFCGADFLVYTHAVQKGQGAVLFDKGKVIIAGDHADVVAANRLHQPGANLLWFRRDGKTYEVRDAVILQRADAWAASVARHLQNEHALNSGLEKLNRRMGVLNQHMGKLNQQMSVLNDRQRTLTAQDGAHADPRAEADIQTGMAGIEANMRAQQAQIDVLQGSMDARQAGLQKWQRKYSGEFRKIPEGMAKLADKALASGAAREVDR